MRIARIVLPVVLLLIPSCALLPGCSGGSFDRSSSDTALRRFEGSYTLNLTGTIQQEPAKGSTVEGSFTGIFTSFEARGVVSGTLSQTGYSDQPATGVFLPNGSFTLTATPQQGQTTTLTGQAVISQNIVTVSGTFTTHQSEVILASGTFTGSRVALTR